MSKQGFSEFEKQAMKERAQELRRDASQKKNPLADLLEKIAAMPEDEAYLAAQLHELVQQNAPPQLQPKTWYGMPAYANQEGKVVLFFQPATKFKARYSTLGFNDSALLDMGKMWPTAYALCSWDADIARQVAVLIRKAVTEKA